MNIRITQLGDQLKQAFNDKILDLQRYMDMEVGQLVSRIDKVETEVNIMKAITQDQQEYDPETTVVATGVAFHQGENIHELSTDIVRRGLSLPNISVVRALRLEGRGQRPGIVKMQFNTLDDKKQLSLELRKNCVTQSGEMYI